MTELVQRVHRILLDGSQPKALVYDAGKDPRGRPDAGARQVAAKFLREERALLTERCLGVDFSFASAMSRGVLTAIVWLQPPPMEIGVHADSLLAVRAAIDRLGPSRLEPHAILHELDLLRRSA